MKGVKNRKTPYGKLTKGQRAVLQYIADCIKDGLAPSRAEITEHFEWSSPNAAQTYLKHLERNGFLELAAGKVARGIKLTPLAHVTLGT
jgi:repressor LexA